MTHCTGNNCIPVSLSAGMAQAIILLAIGILAVAFGIVSIRRGYIAAHKRPYASTRAHAPGRRAHPGWRGLLHRGRDAAVDEFPYPLTGRNRCARIMALNRRDWGLPWHSMERSTCSSSMSFSYGSGGGSWWILSAERFATQEITMSFLRRRIPASGTFRRRPTGGGVSMTTIAVIAAIVVLMVALGLIQGLERLFNTLLRRPQRWRCE